MERPSGQQPRSAPARARSRTGHGPATASCPPFTQVRSMASLSGARAPDGIAASGTSSTRAPLTPAAKIPGSILYGGIAVVRSAHAAGAGGAVHGYTENKDSYLVRLRRIEGQVRGLQRMVEDDKYCIDILTQVAAVTRALQSVALGLLDEHLSHCVTEAVAEGGDAADAKVREASDAIARLVRS